MSDRPPLMQVDMPLSPRRKYHCYWAPGDDDGRVMSDLAPLIDEALQDGLNWVECQCNEHLMLLVLDAKAMERVRSEIPQKGDAGHG